MSSEGVACFGRTLISALYRIGLVFIACLLGAFVGFFTMGLNKVLCPASAANLPNQLVSIGKDTSSECPAWRMTDMR